MKVKTTIINMNIVIHLLIMQDFEIRFHPIGRKLTCSRPISILKAAEKLGLDVAGPCGGNGKCGKCKVKVVEFPNRTYIPPDPVSRELLTELEQKKGLRLACTTIANDDIGIELPSWAYENANEIDESRTILVAGQIVDSLNHSFSFEPVIRGTQCSLPRPSLDDNISDLERLRRCIEKSLKLDHNEIDINNSLMRELSARLRNNDWTFEAILAELPFKTELLDLVPYNLKILSNRFGIAMDIGTTTLVAYLLDLTTGEELGATSMVNPQVRIGADVISRVRYASNTPNGVSELTKILHDAINFLIQRLCDRNNISNEEIFEVVAVGNTIMLHLFLGLPVTAVGAAPYTPVSDGNIYSDASEIGLKIHPRGKIYVSPLVSGFLGADAVGLALVTDMLPKSGSKKGKAKIKLALDIGTNGEILLSNHDRLLACSAAAGPAFEGGNLRFGVRAGLGAINQVEIINQKVRTYTIGNRPALGVTGSAVVDAISAFRRVGAIQTNGNIDQTNAKKWLKFQRKLKLKRSLEPTTSCDLILPELVLVPKGKSALDAAVTITQSDIREIQLAKAAIYTGIEVLMTELSVNPSDIDEVYLAGAFGNYLKPKNTLEIKLLPEVDINRIKSIGNAAGMSAKVLLRSRTARESVNNIAKKIEYIDLATHPKFQDLFIKNMTF